MFELKYRFKKENDAYAKYYWYKYGSIEDLLHFIFESDLLETDYNRRAKISKIDFISKEVVTNNGHFKNEKYQDCAFVVKLKREDKKNNQYKIGTANEVIDFLINLKDVDFVENDIEYVKIKKIRSTELLRNTKDVEPIR